MPIGSRPAAAQQGEKKLFVGESLAKVRADVTGRLEDRDLRDVFNPDNRTTVAVLVKITRRERDVTGIAIYTGRRGDSERRLRFVKSLKRDDPDFRVLVEVCKIRR